MSEKMLSVPLDEYLELVEFRKQIESGDTCVVVRDSMGCSSLRETSYISKSNSLDYFKRKLEDYTETILSLRKYIRELELENTVIPDKDLKSMSWREFRRIKKRV